MRVTVELSPLVTDSKYQVAYQIGSESFSNDPPTKGNPYKSWFTTIGSARPIRGINFRTVVMRLEMDWSQMNVTPEPYVFLLILCSPNKLAKGCGK